MIKAFQNHSEEDSGSDSLAFVRIMRLNRLSKMFKMLKLFRLVKFLKSNYINKVTKSVMQATMATERLTFFILVTVLGFHLCNCMWLWCAMFFGEWYETTWITTGGWEEETRGFKYRTSMY